MEDTLLEPQTKNKKGKTNPQTEQMIAVKRQRVLLLAKKVASLNKRTNL
jgi:hypothetical protein